ncbi:hypothetical protein SacmaDRAFT_4680 [Saccharomonospora marina XMU15]|uniref:DUF6292 domain-containing protein n=1 Tax=Saccharomonospora marina XMU15 TaxID=882083 RepID=H5WXY7_9PSEU|nr:DUF6292 family protein [Saccharomonospora marina]EHR52854.1 hypothetical protein SacmaDRAFT_4680 [Saccharomonospora marina XMU15]
MDLEFHGAPAQGLRRYVRLVREALELVGDCSCVQLEPPANAYLAVEGSLAWFPGRDVALIWDEENGWAVAVEAHCGEDLLVQDYLGADILPEPGEVARFAKRVMQGERVGLLDAPALRTAETQDELPSRLAEYAVPVAVPS